MQEGTRLGPYELIKRIGIGGMAEIYLAKTTGIGGFEKFLALKVIHPKFAEDQEFIDMLIDEAKIAVQLNHVNVGQIFDLGCLEGNYYIAMEFVDGRDLYQLLVQCAEMGIQIPFDIIAYVIRETAAALQYAHTKTNRAGQPLNLIHRDVSPQNILISYDGQIKLVDFGIAKASQRRQQTESGVIKGKFFYMSPEQAWGDPLDGRSDVFSCGICLYEMIAGEMLYNEERALVLLDRVRRAVIPDVREKRSDIPREIEAIIKKALAREKIDRFSTAGELRDALSGFLYGHWPSFNPKRVGQFLQEVFGNESPVIAAQEEELDPPTLPSPLVDLDDDDWMEADDFDRTRGHSVIFALGKPLELDQMLESEADADDEFDGDRTLASPYFADVLPVDEPSWSHASEPTQLLDGQEFQDDDRLASTAEIERRPELPDPDQTWRSPIDEIAPGNPVSPLPQVNDGLVPDMPTASISDDSSLEMTTEEAKFSKGAAPNKRDLGAREQRSHEPEQTPSRRPQESPSKRLPTPLKARDTITVTQDDDRSRGWLSSLLKWIVSPTIITILVLLGLGVYAGLEYLPTLLDRQSPGAVIRLGTVPAGASVSIDGYPDPVKTPAEISGFKEGDSLRITIQKPGFRTRVEVLQVAGERNKSGQIEVRRKYILQSAKGTLDLKSTPTKAEVFLDGILIGKTPLRADKLQRQKQRPVLLVFKKEGFKDLQQSFRWGNRTLIRLDVELEAR